MLNIQSALLSIFVKINLFIVIMIILKYNNLKYNINITSFLIIDFKIVYQVLFLIEYLFMVHYSNQYEK